MAKRKPTAEHPPKPLNEAELRRVRDMLRRARRTVEAVEAVLKGVKA